MDSEKQKPSQRLTKRPRTFVWELAVLIVLLVTVLGIALRGPVKSFPLQDPYDLHGERTITDARSRVEIGQ